MLMLPLICSLFCLLVASCKKADYKPSVSTALTNVNSSTLATSLFSSLYYPPQVINVTAGVYSTVTASHGTKLKFYPYSFKDYSGRTITSGTVQIGITEMYGAGAGLANRSVSLSGNELLQNGGQIYITASMAGQPISVNKYGVGFLAQPNLSSPMGLYYGSKEYGDSLTRWITSGYAAGTMAMNTSMDTMSVYLIDSTGTHVDTANLYRNYNMFDSCSRLQWVGCLYPNYVAGKTTNITVTPSDTLFTTSNTLIFVVFPGINSVVPVNKYDPATHSFSLPLGYEIPRDVKVHIVTIGYTAGNLHYSAQMNVTPSQGTNFRAEMQPYTVREVLNSLLLL